MKRYIKSRVENTVYSNLLIEIDLFTYLNASSDADLINTNDPRVIDFEGDLLELFEDNGYELEEDHASNYTFRGQPSKSHYYTFFRVNRGIQEVVTVEIRVANHRLRNKRVGGKLKTGQQRGQEYVTKLGRNIADRELGPESDIDAAYLDIVIDGKPVSTFEDALRRIKKELSLQ